MIDLELRLSMQFHQLIILWRIQNKRADQHRLQTVCTALPMHTRRNWSEYVSSQDGWRGIFKTLLKFFHRNVKFVPKVVSPTLQKIYHWLMLTNGLLRNANYIMHFYSNRTNIYRTNNDRHGYRGGKNRFRQEVATQNVIRLKLNVKYKTKLYCIIQASFYIAQY